MKKVKHWSIWRLWVIALLLAACVPTTKPPPASPTTSSSPDLPTDAPALNPVTPTPENVFATDPAATKNLPADSETESREADSEETESHEASSEVGSRTNVDIGEAVLVYERAGGLKGIGPGVITWTMYPNGRIISSDGRSWQLAPTDMTALIDSIMALGFADFEASYIPKDTCCDRATHTITIRQGDEVYQVAVLDGANAPAELYQVLDIIGEFLVALPN